MTVNRFLQNGLLISPRFYPLGQNLKRLTSLRMKMELPCGKKEKPRESTVSTIMITHGCLSSRMVKFYPLRSSIATFQSLKVSMVEDLPHPLPSFSQYPLILFLSYNMPRVTRLFLTLLNAVRLLLSPRLEINFNQPMFLSMIGT